MKFGASSATALLMELSIMKFIIISLIFFSQNQNADCANLDFFHSMSRKLSEFASYASMSIKNWSTNVAHFFFKKNHPLSTNRRDNDNMNNAFSDFIFEISAEEMKKDKYYSITDDIRMSATPDLALSHGRHMESHIVQTKDGYFLTLHRILANDSLQYANRTVLLHHGLFGSSTDWILLGPQKSLPYLLSDAGYDVWIANARGNYFSRSHLIKRPSSADFWKFSWQEMGEYDLPATIDYIREVKNSNESINFIGHSMGATALLVLLSTVPHYNEYLRVGILLAPLAYMTKIEGPMKILITMPEETIKLMGEGEFLPSRKVPSWLTTKYCKGPKIFCMNPLFFISGIPQDRNWNASFIARLMYHVPAGGSTNTLLHYMQVMQSGKFGRFCEPISEFRIDNIKVPIAMFSSDNDWLATIPNVFRLYFNIVNPIEHHVIRNMNMTHTDFVWGDNANILVFGKIFDYLENGPIWSSVQANEIN